MVSHRLQRSEHELVNHFDENFDENTGVKTEYLSTNEYSLQNFIAILNQLSQRPDGIAVPILNSEALQPVLDKAIDSGIPVVAFNISDTGLRTSESAISPTWAEMNISRA